MATPTIQSVIGECGATVEPTGNNKWRMQGPRRCVEIELCDEGGWEVREDGVFVRVPTLQLAMTRGYNCVTGQRELLR